MLHPVRTLLAFTVAAACGCAARAEEKTLYEKQSPFNSIVVTENDRGLRTLWFEKGGVRQSVAKPGDPDHLEFSYARTIQVALAFVESPRRVAIIGLGGGTLPVFLHKHYPQARIDAVDIDPVVVDVARRFFGFREDQRMRAHVCDGRQFVEKAEPYDMIYLDAFGADSIPRHLATIEFLKSVRKALSPHGIVVGNIWDRTSNPHYDSMVRTYHEVFDDLYLFDAPLSGNRIVIGLCEKRSLERDEVIRRSARIGRELKLRFDLSDIVREAYRRPDEELRRGSVLRDKDTH